jgi:hypothetical protein
VRRLAPIVAALLLAGLLGVAALAMSGPFANLRLPLAVMAVILIIGAGVQVFGRRVPSVPKPPKPKPRPSYLKLVDRDE